MKFFRWFILTLMALIVPPVVRENFKEQDGTFLAQAISIILFGGGFIGCMVFIMLLANMYPVIKTYCIFLLIGISLFNFLITYGVYKYVVKHQKDLINELVNRSN